MAWTTPRTWTAGEVVTASMLNTHVRDNTLALYGAWTSASVTGATNWSVSNFNYRIMGQLVAVDFDMTYSGTTITAGATGNFADSVVANSGAYPSAIRPTTSAVYLACWIAGTNTFFYRLEPNGTITMTHAASPTSTIASGNVLHTHGVYCIGL